MEGLDNIYINQTLKKLSKDFCGVYSSDNIPTNLLQKDNFIIVCNLSGQFEVGSHFITIVANNDITIYIDSLGFPCLIPEISDFIRKRGNPLYYNDRQIQHANSKYCGFFCIYFTLLFDRALVSQPIFTFSTKKLYENDAKCIMYIKSLIRQLVK